MFNYTKEVIINDPSVIVKGSASNGLGEGVVAVKRGGNYVIDNIEGKKIYKTVGSEGTKAKVTITPVDLSGADVARLTIYLSQFHASCKILYFRSRNQDTYTIGLIKF